MWDKLSFVFSIFGAWLTAEGEKAQHEKDRQEWQAQREKVKANLAITCRRCRALAYPIEGTKNRYRCSCGNQFANARHNL